MANPTPTDIGSCLYQSCQSAILKTVNDTDNWERLQKGSGVIIEKMKDMITHPGYYKSELETNKVVYFENSSQVLAMFVRLLEPVFTGDKEIEMAKVLLPSPKREWSENEIKTLYGDCERAMKLVESNSAISSEKYRQRLQKGRYAIIEIMMEVIMDIADSKKQGRSTGYLLDRNHAPEVLVMFLQHLETISPEGEELGPKEQQAMPATSLVALVEAPDPKRKSGILRTYREMGLSSNIEGQLELLQGKRILNEKWADEGESYDLNGETKTILCMHLWSLMRNAHVSDPQNPQMIWESISKGWPECVSWEEGSYGHFWELIYSEQVPLRLQAEIKGLKSMLDAYKEMEGYFKDKGDKQHCLVNWPKAYYPTEANPNPSVWEDISRELTNISV